VIKIRKKKQSYDSYFAFRTKKQSCKNNIISVKKTTFYTSWQLNKHAKYL